MRLNRGSNERNMAKHELKPCYPINVGWRPKPVRGHWAAKEDKGPKPTKKSRAIMSEINVDPAWVAYTPPPKKLKPSRRHYATAH